MAKNANFCCINSAVFRNSPCFSRLRALKGQACAQWRCPFARFYNFLTRTLLDLLDIENFNQRVQNTDQYARLTIVNGFNASQFVPARPKEIPLTGTAVWPYRCPYPCPYHLPGALVRSINIFISKILLVSYFFCNKYVKTPFPAR